MSGGDNLVKCALCGTEMPVTSRLCPKCNGLNLRYRPAEEAQSLSASPPIPPAVAPVATTDALHTSPPLFQRSGGVRPGLSSSPTPPADLQEQPETSQVPAVPVPQPAAMPEEATPPETDPPVHGYAEQPTPWQYGPVQPVRPLEPTTVDGTDESHYWAMPQPHVYRIPAGQQPHGHTRPSAGAPAVPTYADSQPDWHEAAGPYPSEQSPGSAFRVSRAWVAATLEWLLGSIGFLGIGHMFGGRVARGAILLVLWWAYLWFAFSVAYRPAGVYDSVGIPLICPVLLIHLVTPIMSALWIYRDLRTSR
jgi:hypothetical protein